MKSIISSLALVGLTMATFSASAYVEVDHGWDRVVRIIGNRLIHNSGAQFIQIREVCNVAAVRLVVTGDNLSIDDFKVLYGNGGVQDFATREKFARNSTTNWKYPAGGLRCIEGFYLRARPDWDWQNARVTLQGQQVIGRNSYLIDLGSVLIRDFNF